MAGKPYTGSIDDIQELDIYLQEIMIWIERLRAEYGVH